MTFIVKLLEIKFLEIKSEIKIKVKLGTKYKINRKFKPRIKSDIRRICIIDKLVFKIF